MCTAHSCSFLLPVHIYNCDSMTLGFLHTTGIFLQLYSLCNNIIIHCIIILPQQSEMKTDHPPPYPGMAQPMQQFPPQQQYPPQQTGYPAQQPAYPAQQPAYPTQQPAYPTQQPGYPTEQPIYPAQQQPGYPPQQSDYPPQPNPAHPPQ